jgi:uncharacterized membrane protein YfcA
MFWIWLLFFGVAIGVVSGLLGIGGGVLLIPGLILLFGFSQAGNGRRMRVHFSLRRNSPAHFWW